MIKEKIDKMIDEYHSQTGKELGEIRMSINNFFEFKKELGELPFKNNNALFNPCVYKGINITWGIEI